MQLEFLKPVQGSIGAMLINSVCMFGISRKYIAANKFPVFDYASNAPSSKVWLLLISGSHYKCRKHTRLLQQIESTSCIIGEKRAIAPERK